MKSSLWMVIALVSGVVGFLTGYSVSSYTGLRGGQDAAGREERVQQERGGGDAHDAAGGYGSTAPRVPAGKPAGPAAGY